MIPSYSEYIRRYVHRQGRHSPPSPGEHHFVATYLLPKLYEINGQVPDYVNPDGTKSIVGDVVYYKDERHHFGIEVKLGTIRLTRREFNDWIVNEDMDQWPDLFLGVGKKGLVLSLWSEFRKRPPTTPSAAAPDVISLWASSDAAADHRYRGRAWSAGA